MTVTRTMPDRDLNCWSLRGMLISFVLADSPGRLNTPSPPLRPATRPIQNSRLPPRRRRTHCLSSVPPLRAPTDRRRAVTIGCSVLAYPLHETTTPGDCTRSHGHVGRWPGNDRCWYQRTPARRYLVQQPAIC
jgi:hypothetical protein